jgi:transposase
MPKPPSPRSTPQPDSSASLSSTSANPPSADSSSAPRPAPPAGSLLSKSTSTPIPSSQALSPRKRRVFSADYKLKILEEAAQAHEPGSLGALLRREHLYSSHLTCWRRELDLHGKLGMTAIQRGRKPKLDPKDLRIHELESKLAKVEREALFLRQLVDLQKKVSEMLELATPNEKP